MSVVPGERDPLGPAGDRDTGFGTNRLDPLPANHNDPSLLRGVRRPVPHGAGRQHDRASGVGNTRSRLGRSVSEDGKRYQRESYAGSQRSHEPDPPRGPQDRAAA